MSNTGKTHRPNSLADRIAGINDPSMGDERERDVILRAYMFGSVLTIYVFLALAVLFAVIGAGFWTLPLLLGSGVLSFAVASYCKREGVDFDLATALSSPRRLIISYVTCGAFAVAWVFAIGFHQITGHPLLTAGLGSTVESASGSSIVIGGLVGVAIAIVAMTISRQRKLKQARIEAAREAEIEDED
ncbi:MAG: hypothetical protein L0I80_01065 [Brevibacterium sp.]|uniref:hypothetical protein n=1 Tax=Brevibacterium sp. TaxID=1701 RepID=UPI0026487A28|nr:hypothetical protein [Brevibacterium sp.]MDN5834623.1 hypothetical protein [Brevibacterium sp.]MDN5876372.1 hypothetical protein [Brevibacterium sp.]MDN5909352.1 hypothetical protein [Brevibacterium sp.]MDN6122448.1 hypothetical protein [Brevibacterium sp.]MDN6134482.1 hypothetical protein [Brevibacterium sp.]